jgi:methyl-accepting chemotaxis protein
MSTYGQAVKDTANEIKRLLEAVSKLQELSKKDLIHELPASADQLSTESKFFNAAQISLKNAAFYIEDLSDSLGSRANIELV